MSSKPVQTLDLLRPLLGSLEGLCEILLVRHALPEPWTELTLAEARDAPLSDHGRQQARLLARRLASARFGAVYSSDLRRAVSTAAQSCTHHALKPVLDVALREIDVWQRAPQDKRALELYPGAELDQILTKVVRSRRNDVYPHCEDVRTFRARALAAINGILERHVGERVAVVCHGGVIHAVLAEIFESDVDYLFSLEHTSISTIRGSADGLARRGSGLRTRPVGLALPVEPCWSRIRHGHWHGSWF